MPRSEANGIQQAPGVEGVGDSEGVEESVEEKDGVGHSAKINERDHNVHARNTVVTIRPERTVNGGGLGVGESASSARSCGCYVTWFQVSVLSTAIALAIVLIALLSGYVGWNTHCICEKPSGEHISDAQDKQQNESKNSEINAQQPTMISPLSPTIITKTIIPTSTISPVIHRPKLKDKEDKEHRDKPWYQMRLPRDLIPSHYSLELLVNMKAFVFSGNVNISLRSHRPTRYIVFHTNCLDIDTKSIKVHRAGDTESPIPIEKLYNVKEFEFQVLELNSTLSNEMDYVVSIGHFFGKILPDMRGLYKGTYTTKSGETRFLASTQMQAFDARKVFPCFDEPGMKARFTVTIIYPPDYVALSNMPATSTTVLNDDWRRTQYAPTPIMSTYLLAFVIADYTYKEKVSPKNYTVRVWSTHDKIEQTNYAMSIIEPIYDFFTDYFNVTDVMPKTDHVTVPDFSGGAMENWGLVIYRETSLLYDPEVSSSTNKFLIILIISHEIAHTWFGNMATMKWWDDLWLNEGFASILMYFGINHIYPEWDAFSLQVVLEIIPVMETDALLTSHPVSSTINSIHDIMEKFDDIAYKKGLAILRMLKGFLGWEGFRRSLQNYIKKYQFDNAQMDELWQVYTETINGPLKIKDIMDTWSLQMGYPVINVTNQGDYYQIAQSRFLLIPGGTYNASESPFQYKWNIPFVYCFQSNPLDTKLQWLNTDTDRIKRSESGWILGNVDHTGYYRVNYEVEMWGQLTEQLHRNHTVLLPANRAGLIDDALNLARARLLGYPVALNMTTYLEKEKDYVPWQAFMNALEFINGMLDSTESYGNFKKYLTDLVTPAFKATTFEQTGTVRERLMQKLILNAACDLEIPDAVNYANEMFKKWMNNGHRLSPDLATIIYSVGVREGSTKEWEYVWNRTEHTYVASEKEMLLEALAQTQVPWLLWRYANWIFDNRKIRPQDVQLVAKHLTKSSLGRIMAVQLLVNKWDQILQTFSQDVFLISDLIKYLTKFINNPFHLDQVTHLFRSKPPLGSKNAIDNAIEIIRANVKWVTTNEKVITKWLHQYDEKNLR